MPALTPTSSQVNVGGHRVFVTGKFTSIANADTWTPGLSTIDAVYMNNGQSGQTFGATVSGGTVTFASSAGLANAFVTAMGT